MDEAVTEVTLEPSRATAPSVTIAAAPAPARLGAVGAPSWSRRGTGGSLDEAMDGLESMRGER